MKSIYFFFIAFILISCSMGTSKKLSSKETFALYKTENYGGKAQQGFSIANTSQELTKEINSRLNAISEGNSPASPQKFILPLGKKAIIYDLGTYRSGSHKIKEVLQLKLDGENNSQLNIITPLKEENSQGGNMSIQVISEPWFVLFVDKELKFSTVKVIRKPRNG